MVSLAASRALRFETASFPRQTSRSGGFESAMFTQSCQAQHRQEERILASFGVLRVEQLYLALMVLDSRMRPLIFQPSGLWERIPFALKPAGWGQLHSEKPFAFAFSASGD